MSNISRDEEDRAILPIHTSSPQADPETNELTSPTDSTQSSVYTFSPATWTPQESGGNTRPISPTTPPTVPLSTFPPPIHSNDYDSANMTDISNLSFTGKPEDQDPQDFMNQLERIILMKTGLSELEKVRFLELSLKAKSPAAAWFVTLTKAHKASFAVARDAFELRWPVKAITEKTTAEKQTLLDETVLKTGDLGRRVAASIGAEEELSHVVWADRVERLADDIPDTNNLLVASTRKKLPKPLLKLVGLKPMTWKDFTDAVRAISLKELMEKVKEERDTIRYTMPPNTPSKALGAAFQNINIAPRTQNPLPIQYPSQQTVAIPRPAFSIDRPAHERLADVQSTPVTPEEH